MQLFYVEIFSTQIIFDQRNSSLCRIVNWKFKILIPPKWIKRGLSTKKKLKETFPDSRDFSYEQVKMQSQIWLNAIWLIKAHNLLNWNLAIVHFCHKINYISRSSHENLTQKNRITKLLTHPIFLKSMPHEIFWPRKSATLKYLTDLSVYIT